MKESFVTSLWKRLVIATTVVVAIMGGLLPSPAQARAVGDTTTATAHAHASVKLAARSTCALPPPIKGNGAYMQWSYDKKMSDVDAGVFKSFSPEYRGDSRGNYSLTWTFTRAGLGAIPYTEAIFVKDGKCKRYRQLSVAGGKIMTATLTAGLSDGKLVGVEISRLYAQPTKSSYVVWMYEGSRYLAAGTPYFKRNNSAVPTVRTYRGQEYLYWRVSDPTRAQYGVVSRSIKGANTKQLRREPGMPRPRSITWNKRLVALQTFVQQ